MRDALGHSDGEMVTSGFCDRLFSNGECTEGNTTTRTQQTTYTPNNRGACIACGWTQQCNSDTALSSQYVQTDIHTNRYTQSRHIPIHSTYIHIAMRLVKNRVLARERASSMDARLLRYRHRYRVSVAARVAQRCALCDRCDGASSQTYIRAHSHTTTERSFVENVWRQQYVNDKLFGLQVQARRHYTYQTQST